MIRQLSLLFACAILLLGTSTPGCLVYAQAGFVIYEPERLDSTLSDRCTNALSAEIKCVDYVQTFMRLRYRTSLENVTLTDQVCTSDCSTSLKSWFDSVTTSCAGSSLNGAKPTTFGGYMWAGFNETCVKDPKTKQYCNDLMFNFTSVPDIASMPRAELCHVCHVRRLAMMQSSQYSIYDAIYKEQLEYVYAQCGGSGPTAIPPPLTPVVTEPAPYCVTGKRYTTVEGSTCESIANATGVSSAALYMGNQAILPNCLKIAAGISLCVPMTCQTYYVRPTDTCVSIEMSLGLDFDQVQEYNSWINRDCSNLQPGTDFYGKIICVSPQGGTFTGTVSPPVPTEVADGYTKVAVPPPAGVSVAKGTTLKCGKWHVTAPEDTCSDICIRNGIEATLFRRVNPSLVADDCTSSLKPQTALCVGPTYSWNSTAVMTARAAVMTGAADLLGRAVPISLSNQYHELENN